VKFREIAHTNGQDRKTVFVVGFFIHKLHIKSLCHHCENDLEDALGEGFPEADPLASAEGKESVGASSFAFWSFRKRMRRVETIRQELIWPLPVSTISMKAMHSNNDVIVSLDAKFFRKFCIIFEIIHSCTDSDWVEAK